MPPGRTPLVACVQLAPWPLVLLARQHPSVPVAVLGEGSRKVVFASTQALGAGVRPGMRETAALSRCPELHAEVVKAPAATAAWAELLEVLYARYSDRVEGRKPGLAYLKVSAPAARDLAAALHAPVGLAASLEVAQLAAYRAAPGEVREVPPGAEQAFLRLSQVGHLSVLGLGASHVERLHFLGVRDLGGLMGWSAAQREAFLGVDVGGRINRFLRGERSTGVARYVPGTVIEASLQLESPLCEPGETEVALKDLVPGVMAELRGRTCAYLTLHANTVGGRLSATRKLKWPLDASGLTRVAGLALADVGALALGIDALTVQLSGLQQPARIVGLWAGLAELEVTQAVLDRFPEALVRVEWLDPFAYAVDAQYQWVDWVTGAVRERAMTPRQTWLPPVRRREQAVNRVLAFFEGRDP